MTSDPKDRADAERRLWREIERHNVGMLGLAGCEQAHFQPMTAFAEPANDQIWFYARNDIALVQQIGASHRATFVFQTRDLYACVAGELAIDHDVDRINRYWNAVVAAWYPEGRDDPKLSLLRFDCTDAQVWLSEAGPIRFAWEIAMANARHHTPQLGRHANLDFH